jgi:rSAM/selenodomain-associated transferase 1
MSDTALIIIARYPEPGKTKTRLARDLGDSAVAQLYQAFLTDLAHRLGGLTYDLYWTYTPAHVDYQSFVASLAPEHAARMRTFAQQGPDLGARLLHAFQETRARGYQHTILIGSDSPHISVEIVERALTALDDADVVLGPAEDGGYYLIAMHEPHDVFSAIPMSTAVVTEMTIAAAQQQGLRVTLIDQLFDIDELPDLLRLARLLEENRTLAPATAAYLATMRSLHDNNAHSHTSTLDLHRTNQPM